MTVGVTGGIGSGKSTVCRRLQEEGAFLIEADEVGREVVVAEAVLRELVSEFGSDILDGKGWLDRAELGRRAFSDRSATDRLNRIVWPQLGRLLEEKVRNALCENSSRTVVVDAALLFEWGDPRSLCDVMVVVTASKELRMRRTMDRLGLSDEEVTDRMASQIPEESKVRAADFVIVNDGSREELERSVMDVWSKIRLIESKESGN